MDILEFGGDEGEGPDGDLLFAANGGLFRTTAFGGTAAAGSGTVFHLAPPAVCGQLWTETVLGSFTELNHQGLYPQSGLLAGKGRVFYGMTTNGGGTGSGGGTVFQLTPPTTGSRP